MHPCISHGLNPVRLGKILRRSKKKSLRFLAILISILKPLFRFIKNLIDSIKFDLYLFFKTMYCMIIAYLKICEILWQSFGISFQMSWNLWDFVSQSEIWHVCNVTQNTKTLCCHGEYRYSKSDGGLEVPCQNQLHFRPILKEEPRPFYQYKFGKRWYGAYRSMGTKRDKYSNLFRIKDINQAYSLSNKYTISGTYIQTRNQSYSFITQTCPCNILQYFTAVKIRIFRWKKCDIFWKKCDIFLIFAQNIDRGYMLEPPQWFC